jgi:outer membrane protein TolC
MRLTHIISAGWLAFAVAAEAQPAPTTARIMPLAECIQLALKHNLSVQIERFNPTLSLYALDLAYAPYDATFSMSAIHNHSSSPGGSGSYGPFPSSENYSDTFVPSLSGLLPSGMTYKIDNNFVSQEGTFVSKGSRYSGNATLTLSQPLLRNSWIDSTRLNIQISKKDLKISNLALQLQIMNTVTSVELAYYDLIFTRENVKVQQKALELAERLLAENKKRVEVGALAPLDEKQAESQVAARRSDLLSAQRELAAQQNQLKNLMADDFAAWQNVTIEPAQTLLAMPEAFDLQESWRKGLSTRPDLQQLKIDLEKRDLTTRYQQNQLYPSLDATGSVGRNSLGSAFDHMFSGLRDVDNPHYSGGLVFSMPLGNRDARVRLQTTKAGKQQAALRVKKLEQDILVQIDDAVKLARTNFERVDATKQARLYAEAALEAEQKKLENGKSTSFFVLQLQRDLTSARSAEIRALADYNKSLSSVSLNEGSTLERNKLSLEVK